MALKIFIVDDQPANLKTMKILLKDLGADIITALSGNEALLLTLKHEFTLILLDVQMPMTEGFETAELIQSNEETRNTPIIFVTAISKEEQYRRTTCIPWL